MKANNILFITLFVFFGLYVSAQNSLISFEYTYDGAGNRTSRIVFDISSNRSITDSTLVNDLEKLETCLENIKMNMYPNPVVNTLHVEIITEMQNYEKISYQIIDVNGKVIESDFFVSAEADINFSRMDSGIYILRLMSNNNHTEYKIIKER